MDPVRAAERAARESYGRLVSIIAARTGDIAEAEDALADAFAAALATWPKVGTPANPEGWLVTAARNRVLNSHRARSVRSAAAEEIERRHAERNEPHAFPDERLKLLFVCAHPAIDAAIRTPLMLQAALGLDAARIASAFAVPPATMSQRLVRAKTKIKAARVPFETPNAEEWPGRLNDTLDAIYGAFGAGWDSVAGAETELQRLTEEAIYLGRLTVSLLPEEPEPKGLLALMLFCDARRAARFDAAGVFVPLLEQDTSLWDRDAIREADALLTAAAARKQFGRYQCEAAIQSVHAQRPITGRVNHEALGLLYKMLAAAAPSLGVLVAQAAAQLQAGDAEQALRSLDDVSPAGKARYQPYWVTRWACLDATGREREAQEALEIAIGLSEHPAVRRYLLRQAGETRP